MSDLFICYSRTDSAIANRLAERLRAEGWSVFLDVQTRVGQRWHKEIEAQMHAARALVALWSARSRESDFVLEEAEYGKRKGNLFPALIERVEFPYGFSRLQTADLVGWAGDPDHPGLRELLDALRQRLGSAPVAPPAAQDNREAPAAGPYEIAPAQAAPPPAAQAPAVPGDVKRKAKAIMQVFESGRTRNYTYVAATGGDLEFGLPFASLRRGTLHALVKRYCEDPAARFAQQLAAHLPALEARDAALASDESFQNLLRKAAGEDPAMIALQDAIFDAMTWDAAATEAQAIGVRTPLGIAAVFDCFVHGGRGMHERIKAAAIRRVDGTPVTGIDEKEWVVVYLKEREAHLAARRITEPTAYRPRELLKLAEAGNWELQAPVTVRGKAIAS